MGKKARNYTQLTLKRLFALSGNQCAFPNCSISFTNSTNTQNLSNICHIEAAEEGGERYNVKMTDKERADYDNLILLCPNHHLETNDVEKYTVDVLKKMKESHEKEILRKITVSGELNKYPSFLALVVNHIASINLEEIDGVDLQKSFNPEEKIAYNAVKDYVPTLDEYKVYHGKLNKLYLEMELQGSFKKIILLQNIKNLYLKAKKKILQGKNDMESIRANADNLIKCVEDELWDLFEKSPNANISIPIEVITIAIYIIVVDAFIRCKILEEPHI